MSAHNERAEPLTVTLIETNDNCLTGVRLRSVEHYLQNEECFCFTFGDGVSDVYKNDLIDFIKSIEWSNFSSKLSIRKIWSIRDSR